MSTREEAILQQITWKAPEMERFAVQVVRRAVALYRQGIPYFGSDDVDQAPDSNGTAGNVMHILGSAHVIRHWWGHDPVNKIRHGTRPSKRLGSKGARIDLYELCNMAAAETFLVRHGAAAEPAQSEMSWKHEN